MLKERSRSPRVRQASRSLPKMFPTMTLSMAIAVFRTPSRAGNQAHAGWVLYRAVLAEGGAGRARRVQRTCLEVWRTRQVSTDVTVVG